MLEQPPSPAHPVPSALRGRLFRKYVVIFIALVSGALLTSGLVEAYFVYTENQAAVIRLQRERAEAAASSILQYLGETERLLGWVALSPPDGVQAVERRRADFERLLELAPAIQDVGYVDAEGDEQVWVTRQAQGGREQDARCCDRAESLFHGCPI